MRKAIAALGAVALLAVPATAHANTTVGGGTTSATWCDVTLVSFTIDPSTGQVSFDAGSADCDFAELMEAIRKLLVWGS